MSQRDYFGYLFAILLLGLFLRYYLAINSVYIFDEHREWILTASEISLSEENFNLPVRTEFHNALVSYIIYLGSFVDSDNHLAYRWTSILAVILTIFGAAEIGRRLFGPIVGVTTAFLLALNEYHIQTSMLAVQLSWHYCFTVFMIFFALKFINSRRKYYLYACALFAGLSFLSYEIGAVSIFTVAAFLIARIGISVFRRYEFYIAAAIAILVILPDLLTNSAVASSSESGYGVLLDRISNIGLNLSYIGFYALDLLSFLYERVLGRNYLDFAFSYKAMNSLFGASMALGIIWSLIRLKFPYRTEANQGNSLLISIFLVNFLFFSLLKTEGGYSLWLWVGITMFPAIILTANAAIHAARAFRIPIIALIFLGAAFSLYQLAFHNFGMPRLQAHIQPAPLSGPRGETIDSTIFFDICDACDQNAQMRLVDIAFASGPRLSENRPENAVSIRGTDLAKYVEWGSDVRQVSLQIPVGSDEEDIIGMYFFEFTATSATGKGETFTGTATIVNERSEQWPRAFWLPSME